MKLHTDIYGYIVFFLFLYNTLCINICYHMVSDKVHLCRGMLAGSFYKGVTECGRMQMYQIAYNTLFISTGMHGVILP